MRFKTDGTLRLLTGRDGRRRVIGGSPLRMWTLTDGGAALLDRVAAGSDVDASAGEPVRALVDRFVDAGLLHPDPVDTAEVDAAPGQEQVTVVVPVRDRPDELDRLLTALARTAPGAPVVVVDDASVDAESHERVAVAHGTELIRRHAPGGPAAARTEGLAVVRTPFVAVVDSDTEPTEGWLGPLLAHLGDPRVAAVAPRIRSVPGPGALGTYERLRSPLDLGAEPAGVRPGSRVSYVPTAALVVRITALREVGGFDPDMNVGEDVDLVWRLVGAGWRVRYEPSSVVEHPPRAGVVAWVRQRVAYGSSAAALDRRHPGQVAPLSCSPWSAAGWAVVAAGHPLVGLAVLGASAAMLPRRLPSIGTGDALRLAVAGHLGAGRQSARAVLRAWWPIVASASVGSTRARRVGVASVLSVALDAVVEARRSELKPSAPTCVTIASLAVLDDVAYGAGVWLGCVRARSFRALLPRFPHPLIPHPELGSFRADNRSQVTRVRGGC